MNQLQKMKKFKIELLKDQHPQQYKALDKLGLKRALADMNVPIKNDIEYENYREERQSEIKKWYEMVEKDIELNGKKSGYALYHKYFKRG